MPPLSDDFSARIGELEAELASNPSPGVYAPLAEAYRLSGQFERALETAQRGVDAHPEHLGIRIVLARAIAECKGQGQARPAYEEVLVRDANNLEAQAFLEAAQAADEDTPAESELPAAVTDEEDRAAHEGERELEPRAGTGSLSEELAHLADLFVPAGSNSGTPSVGPSSIATLTLAEIYSRQGLFGKAAEICERILEREPGNEQAREALEEYRRHPAAV